MNSISKVVVTVLTFGVPLLIDVLARKKLDYLLDKALHCHVTVNPLTRSGSVELYLAYEKRVRNSIKLSIDYLDIIEP